MKPQLIITLLLLAFNLPLSCLAAPEIKGAPDDLRDYFHPKQKTINIRSSAEETAYTDEAIVNLVVKTKEDQLASAISANTKLRQSIKHQLISKGLKAESIKNSKFSSSPQYGWFGSKPNSFEVMNRVAITITKESQLEEIARIADTNPEVSLSGTSFKHSKKTQFEELVKKKALDKVLKKKAFYEKSLGVKLTAVSFSESDVGFQATQGANALEEEIVVTGIRASKSRSYSESMPQRAQDSFDEVKYRAAISVEYRVE